MKGFPLLLSALCGHGLRRYSHLPADFADLLASFDLPQCVDDLLLAVPLSSAYLLLRARPEEHIHAAACNFPTVSFLGFASRVVRVRGHGDAGRFSSAARFYCLFKSGLLPAMPRSIVTLPICYIWRNECPSSKHFGYCIDQVGTHPHFRYVCVASCRQASPNLIQIL